jgi:hypothetical protein
MTLSPVGVMPFQGLVSRHMPVCRFGDLIEACLAPEAVLSLGGLVVFEQEDTR